MMSMGTIAIIILAVVVIAAIAVVVAMSGRTSDVASAPQGDAVPPPTGDDGAVTVAGRARVTGFHVHGNEARVTFDIPVTDSDDEVVAALLSDQAVEVVREKRHTLPINDVEQAVVFTGGDTPVELTRVRLRTPGELPDPGTQID